MNRYALLASVCALPLLCACAREGTPAPSFGNAVSQDIATQTVNPAAPENPVVTADGEHAGLAQDRYAKGKVKEPASVTTSSQSGGGGSGSSGGGGGSLSQ
jgi:hypothetical protein